MKFYSPAASFGALVIGVLLFGMSAPARAQFGPETKLSVGVFSRSLVVQAYYRSAAWNTKVQAMIDQRNQAVSSGDVGKLDSIDRELNAMQTLAQKQMSGDAPIKNILDQLEPDWPAIAKDADVDVIVEAAVYLAPSAGVTDVTPYIVKRLLGR